VRKRVTVVMYVRYVCYTPVRIGYVLLPFNSASACECECLIGPVSKNAGPATKGLRSANVSLSLHKKRESRNSYNIFFFPDMFSERLFSEARFFNARDLCGGSLRLIVNTTPACDAHIAATPQAPPYNRTNQKNHSNTPRPNLPRARRPLQRAHEARARGAGRQACARRRSLSHAAGGATAPGGGDGGRGRPMP
jgi:hypothetical protein